MKKNLFLAVLAIAISAFSFAQQRITLVEHFTGANCSPCASTNPIVDPIYEANFPDVVVIKYQFPAPSGDIMYYENIEDVATRSYYYGVNSAPSGFIDGKYKTSSSSSVVAMMTNANLQAAVARTSDWNASVDFEIIEGKNVKVTMDIKSLVEQSGNFVVHIALIEKQIVFAQAPGTNGEKVFNYVMRKMLPTANGTTLKTSWTANEDFTITEEIVIPNYYRDLSQLAVVAFIQDNATKIVAQASYAAPKTFENTIDIQLLAVETITKDNLIPTVTVKSTDIQTLTSAIFVLESLDGSETSLNWTGSIDLNNGEAEIELTDLPLTLRKGNNQWKITIWAPNGEIDVNTQNNSILSNYVIDFYPAEKKTLPLIEDFEEGGTPSTLENSIITDWNDGGTLGVYRSGADWKLGANNSEAALLFRNYKNTVIGDYDDFYFPTLNVEEYNQLYLSFYYAYCPRNKTTNDTLLIHVSTDDGETWNEIFRRTSSDLNTSTSATTSNEFFPQTQGLWKLENIVLDEYVNSSSLIIRFRVINGYNNTLSLDRVQVSAEPVVSLPEVAENVKSFETYITNGILNVNFALSESADTKIKLYDITGNEVYTKNMGNLTSNTYNEIINVSNLSKGIYLVVLNIGGQNVTQKVIIQ